MTATTRTLVLAAALALAGCDPKPTMMVTCTRPDGSLAYKGEAMKVSLQMKKVCGNIECWVILTPQWGHTDTVSSVNTCVAEPLP